MPSLKKIVNKRLGEILEDAGYLSSGDIQEALRLQKEKGLKFGEILVREGYCTEENIIRALVNQLNAPFLNIDGYKLNEELVRRVPYTITSSAGLIPLDQIGNLSLVAITSPVSMEIYNQLESILGSNIHLCIGDINKINQKLEEIYPADEKKVAAKVPTASVSAQDHAVNSNITKSEETEEKTADEEVMEDPDGMTGLGNLLLGD